MAGRNSTIDSKISKIVDNEIVKHKDEIIGADKQSKFE